MHELDNVINKFHNTACSFDENNFHPNMIFKSGPKFRTGPMNLFNSCLTNKVWPWTESRVLFIGKPSKPDYTDPSAYRPICMSSHVGNVFEWKLNSRLEILLMNNPLIDHKQDGFSPKKVSTTHTLLSDEKRKKLVKMRRLKTFEGD